MKTIIKAIKALHGDSFLVTTMDSEGKDCCILVDGGVSKTYDDFLKKELLSIDRIRLIILTHIDSDHIGGLIKFFRSSLSRTKKIEEIWVNAPELIRVGESDKISFSEGNTLLKLLRDNCDNEVILKDNIIYNSQYNIAPGINIKVLSPTKEILKTLYSDWLKILMPENKEKSDVEISTTLKPIYLDLSDLVKKEFIVSQSIENDIFNSSSIAFILETLDCKLLMLGDSRAEIIEKSLLEMGYSKENPLKVDCVKISHHGSMNNTSCELLDLIDCNNYIISTNGGSSNHKHPDRETLARIIYHANRNFNVKRNFFFNYSLDKIQEKTGLLFSEEDKKNGNWEYKDNTNSLSF